MATAHESSPLLGHQTSTGGAAPYNTSSDALAHQTEQPLAKSPAQQRQETKGLIYMTLSAFFFSFMSLLVSLTAKTIPSFEIVLFRGIIQGILGVIACHYLGVSPFGNPGVRFLLFCRGLAGSFGLAFFFYALSVMPLADATVIFFLGPVFTAILGRIVLKEPFTPLDALASTVTMIGVVLVAKPSMLFPAPPSGGDSDAGAMILLKEEADRRSYGVLAGVCGAMCSAVAYNIVRKIGKQGAHSMQHVTYFGAVSCVISIIGLYTMQGGYVHPQGSLTWVGILLLGVSAFVGQILLNSGFLGATLVISCTGGMALNKWRLEKKRAARDAVAQTSSVQA
ncbi:hypothetical protein BGW38_002172 [Lunasporangiospora selenospora]|uniref:EamA domain-containing protein n=1 Tax=Lunasporangiospora selenospora TaxID=979761 RepID=A0A9P6G1S0_9FUNG|nr:hypothetical protein BGW38_002172 [Lunasporangiospora selenospora]